ncbi:HU family DNA-binding protein [Snodgrassella sp. CFCC 13594]|uniref:HU family DNA-binding protein n=1 Tax=Snodgrassella sp. CFCC 13594 TaxID=1775559 RepID=UPI00082FD054|nr:HU family DNA-binding protein [Snodgrassella sp. CFCC 13594]
MNKSELIQAMATEAELTKAQASAAVDAFEVVITRALSEGTSVALVGFGTFSIGERQARTGRNPKTGEELKIPAARVPKFKAGKTLKDAVQ